MPTTLDSLYRYPVKGLTPERLESIVLQPGRGVPTDRRYALAKPDGAYRADAFVPLSKREYFVLLNTERLAGLRTRFDDDARTVEVTVQGHRVLEADLTTADGREAFVELYARVADLPDGVRPVLAEQAGYNFTDNAKNGPRMMHAISLVSLASVRDLSERIGHDLDPLRFRSNVYLEGLEPWAERDWVGRELQLGDVRVRILEETGRCVATEVDPTTARRDVPVVRLLHEHCGHENVGVFAEVLSGGVLRPGDAVVPGDPAVAADPGVAA